MAPEHDPNLSLMKELARQWVEVQPMVLAYIRSVVDRYVDAEDVLQCVAQDVIVKYAQYDRDRPFIGWVLWLAKSRVIDHYRRQGRDRHMFGDEVFDRLSEACAALQPESSLRQEALNDCIKRLPAKSVQLLELRYIDDLKPHQMAESLGTTSGTVRVALARMRKALERCINEWLRREGRRV